MTQREIEDIQRFIISERNLGIRPALLSNSERKLQDKLVKENEED